MATDNFPQFLLDSWTSLRPYELILALISVTTIPFILHCVFFRTSRKTTIPSILLLGPSDSGKTSLFKKLGSGRDTKTHTSQTSSSVEIFLPAEITTGSDTYRSVNDPSRNDHSKFTLIDTPGHGKLRHLALQNIMTLENLRGIIFMVDASSFKSNDDSSRETANFLYDVLLSCRNRAEIKNSKETISVMIAVNKTDLFTAMPVSYVRRNLELEITKIRGIKSNAILGIETVPADEDEGTKDSLLGEKGSTSFRFSHMKEVEDISVDISDGNVMGENSHVENWLLWITKLI